MPINSTISRADYENFLIACYFGSSQDLLIACINRAYRDFNRTMHGFGKFEDAGDLYEKAALLLKESLENLKSLNVPPTTPEVFDAWHKSTCEKIISLFDTQGFHFYVGQAQKWVNMTLKYIFTLGESRIPGFEFAYAYCHVPLDNILLDQLSKYGFPALKCAWSRLDIYGDYFEKQNWIRKRFSLIPLDVEFSLWLGKDVES